MFRSAISRIAFFRAPVERPRLLSWTTILLVLLSVAFQLSTLWGITSFKDMEGGDAAYYMTDAHLILDTGHVRIMWSPLYTATLAGVLAMTRDAFTALIATRVIALLLIAPLVMLLFRRFLSPALAIALFAIFAFNPAYFDAMFTVHLWALILPMLALVIAAYTQPRHSIAWVIALLGVQALLMRNEYGLALVLFIVLLVYPGRLVSLRPISLARMRHIARRFWFVPAILATVVVAMILLSEVSVFGQVFQDRTALKHTLNVCQIYAYFLQQNGDLRVVDPWNGCEITALADLGAEHPSLVSAFLHNPAAIVRLMAFNVSLIPNGFQILMSGGFFGGDTPDYWPQRTRVMAPVIALVFAIIAARGFWAHRDAIRRPLTAQVDRGLVVFAMLSMSVVGLMIFVTVTQRPRPSYLFLFGILVLLAVGLGVQAMRHQSTRALAIIAVVGLSSQLVVSQAVSPIFGPDYSNVFSGVGQPVLQDYRELQRRIGDLPATPVNLEITTAQASWSQCRYLARTQDSCTALSGPELDVVVRPRE